MRQKGFAPLIIVIILTLVGVVGAYYLGGLNKSKTNVIQPNTQPQITEKPSTATPNTTPNVTANWKTYTNTKYLYTFQYPQQYSVKNNNAEGYDNNISTSFSLDVFNPSKEPSLVFAVYIEEPNTDFATYANNLFTTFSTFKFPQSDKDYQNPLGSIEDNSVVTGLKKEMFNGLNAYTFTIRGNYIGNAGLPTKTPLTTKYILLNSKGEVYILKVLNPSSESDSLLNTFKLTQ